MNDTNGSDSEQNEETVLKGTLIHVRVPNQSFFRPSEEPVPASAMATAVKLFIAEHSAEIFTLEIEAVISG